MNAEIISKVLYRHDPARTCCNVCEDMDDEYDQIAAEIARLPDQPPSFAEFRSVLAASFLAEALSDEALRESYREIYDAAGQ